MDGAILHSVALERYSKLSDHAFLFAVVRNARAAIKGGARLFKIERDYSNMPSASKRIELTEALEDSPQVSSYIDLYSCY